MLLAVKTVKRDWCVSFRLLSVGLLLVWVIPPYIMVKRKETNTHRFKGFSERIAAIKIDVTHKIQRSTETPEDEDTFFCEGLSKWTELNCTLHFQDFSSRVKEYVQSLAQLVHHKEQVIELLKVHLQIRGSLALQSLLNYCIMFHCFVQNSSNYPLK